MKLEELKEKVFKAFMIDDELKVVKNGNTLEFMEITYAVYDEKGNELIGPDLCGLLFTAEVKDKKIATIELHAFSFNGDNEPNDLFITRANKDLYLFIVNLIGEEIEDFEEV